ncbi:hypothetical protein POM88_036879 [Heracleum sosnowskyi]|uniref:Uncharacterized protein n=1 Tax=Heracleum sosnowskyi TaxID=360622 RepID=A0AAD8MFD2_9APIA|nr:hypothetical protein POM88_036879 [Heracleum sosnowskyi]
MNGAEIDRCLESDFSTWFKNYAQDASLVLNEYVRDLASGPLRSVRSVLIYYVNGYKFHTRTYGANKSTFNSGIKMRSPFFQAPQRSPEQTSQRSPDQAPHRSPDQAPQRSPDQALHQTQHHVAHTRVDTPEHTRAGTT